MTTLTFFDMRIHKTTPQYRAGLLHIFLHVKEIIHHPILNTVIVSSLTKYVHKLEAESTPEFQLGLYAGVSWIRHALHSVETLDSVHVNELLEQIQKNICEIDKLST